MKNKTLEKWIASLSCCILINAFCWQFIFFQGYFYPTITKKLLGLIVLNIFIFSFIYYYLFMWLESSNKLKKTISYFFSFLSFMFILRYICKLTSSHFYFLTSKVKIILFLVLLCLLVVFFGIIFIRKKTSYFYCFFIILFPFSILSLYQMLSPLFFLKKEPYVININRSEVITKKRPKIIWVIFDELDYHMLYNSNLKLEEFKDLREKAFFAEKSFQPDTDTIRSMPAYVLGKKLGLKVPEVTKSCDLKIFLENDKAVLLGQVPNIFSKAREKGYKICLIGWALPYNRIFAKEINDSLCFMPWEQYFIEKKYGNNFFYFNFFMMQGFLKQNLSFLFTNEKDEWNLWKPNVTPKMIDFHIKSLKKLKKTIINSDNNFIFFHCCLPHRPGIFDEKQNTFLKSGKGSYVGNLFLVDKTIKYIRNLIKKSSDKEKFFLIITSDHWLRVSGMNPDYITKEIHDFCLLRKNPYIPFIVELPNQEKGIKYSKSFNAIIVHELILEIMKERINNYNDIQFFINKYEEKKSICDKKNDK